MLSGLSCSTVPFHIPIPLDSSVPYPEEDPLAPLNFDDLLDIAREFEFTRTITHIWPCEEDSSACLETPLDDILAVIVSTPNAEECPIPLPSPSSLMVDPVHVQEINSHRPASQYPAPDTSAYFSTDHVPLPEDDDQARAEVEASVTSALQGWSPPNGSEFLDLDDSFMQPAKDTWNASWLAMFLATQPVGDIDQSSATAPATADVQPHTSTIVPIPPPTSTTDEMASTTRKMSVPIPVEHSTPNILESVQAQSTAQTNSNVTSQIGIVAHAKTSKSRSAPAMCDPSTGRYARAPRGGIPPHIARSVTKANILRVEKERKVIQDAFCSTATGQMKKPSVLRKASKVEKETSKNVNSSGSGKKPFDWGKNDDKERRAAKRARV